MNERFADVTAPDFDGEYEIGMVVTILISGELAEIVELDRAESVVVKIFSSGRVMRVATRDLLPA